MPTVVPAPEIPLPPVFAHGGLTGDGPEPPPKPPLGRSGTSAAAAAQGADGLEILTEPPVLPRDGVEPSFPQLSKEGLVEGENSAPLTDDDMARWRGVRIRPLAATVEAALEGSGIPAADVSAAARRWGSRWRALAPWLQANESYPDPVAVEAAAGDSLSFAAVYAASHPKSTVLSLRADGKTRPTPPPPRNVLSLALPQDRTAFFSNFFASCALFNSAFLLGDWGAHWADDAGAVLPKIVNSTRSVYVEFGLGGSCGSDLPCWNDDWQTALSSRGVSARVIPVAKLSGQRVLARISLVALDRQCTKTWGGPAVQWDRTTHVLYREESRAVTFQVRSPKKDHRRTIHPLAFLPHVNVEAVLSVGLSRRQRLLFLADMVGTSRWPDPMEHNWVLCTGGILQRIDKIDERFVKKVDEGKAYWGRSTHGYFHLLGDNLCLPKSESSLPAVMAHCADSCACCVTRCNYAPKGTWPVLKYGTPVCSACIKCSKCIREHATSLPPSPSADTPASCTHERGKWHHGVRLWKQWEKANNKVLASGADAWLKKC